MKKTLGILVVLILTLSIALFAGATSPCSADDPPDIATAYTEALSYLAGAQNADGSWGTLPERDTFLVVEAFAWSNYLYENLPEEITNLLMAYVTQLNGKNTDTISRKSFPLMLATQEELDFLAACKNADGGYALAPGLPSTPLDTSVCFPAVLISAIMNNDESIMLNAITYLCDNRAEGGYSLFPGGSADLLTTASAAWALNFFAFVSPDDVNEKIASTLSAVDAYLASIQNADGGFGEQGSTAYETALVLNAVSWSSSTSINSMNAISYLLARAHADGSINGDIATTAMFCSAAIPKPFLPASSITMNAQSFQEGSAIGGTIEVGNRGILPAASVNLSISLDDPANVIENVVVENIPAGGALTLPFQLSAPVPWGTHRVYANISSMLVNTNLYDDDATAVFFVEPGINLASVGASCSPGLPEASKHFELQASIRNTSSKGCGPVFVGFYEDSEVLGTALLPWLSAGEEGIAVLPEVSMAGGEHRLTAVVDPLATLAETNETDNISEFTINVACDVTIPELSSPAQGSIVNTGNPVFSWYPSTGADEISYVLEVSSDPGFGTSTREENIPQAADLVSFTWPATLTGSQYWWRVSASDGLKTTDPSSVNMFKVDTVAPGITITPAAGVFFSPNGDGAADLAGLQLNLTEPADCMVEVVDNAGLVVKTLYDNAAFAAGLSEVAWDGTDESANILEGTFSVRVTATDTAGNIATGSSASIVSDITPPGLSAFTCTPELFSPNADGILDTAVINIVPGEACNASVSLVNETGIDMGLVWGPGNVGVSGLTYTWNGKAAGHAVADGTYSLEVTLRDQAGLTFTSGVPVTLDAAPPTLSYPSASVQDATVNVEVESTGATTVTAYFQGEALILGAEGDIYRGSFDRPAAAGTYPLYVTSTDASGNIATSETIRVLVATYNYSHSWLQTSQTDFSKGLEVNGTDVTNSEGDITLALAAAPVAIAPAIREQSKGLHQASAIVGSDGRIYMAGGKTSLHWMYEPDTFYHNTMYIYNPATDSYSFGANMLGEARITCSVKGADGKIYCFGGLSEFGFSNGLCLTSFVEAYDPVANTWEVKPSLPYNLGLEAGALGPDGCIYLFGGWIHWAEEGVANERTTAVLRYNPATGECTQVGQMPNDEHRCCFYAVDLDGKIYLMGGHTDTTEICNTVWEYDAISNTFASCPDVPPVTEYAYHAYSFGRTPVACQLDNSIYLVGGNSMVRRVLRYQPSSGTWSVMPETISNAEHRAAACIGDKLYIFGGMATGGYASVSIADAEKYSVGYAAEGYFVSEKKKFTNKISIGGGSLTGVLPPGTMAYVSVRYSMDDVTWSDWSQEVPAPGGPYDLGLMDAMWMQYRVRLTTDNVYATPKVSEVSISYNQAPSSLWFVYNMGGSQISPIGTIRDTTPTICWTNCVDADGDPLTATLELDRVSTMNSTGKRVYSGLPATAAVHPQKDSFTIPDDEALAEGTWYYRVSATDGMAFSQQNGVGSFTVDTQAPVLLSAVGTPDPFVPDAGGTWNLSAITDTPANANLELLNPQGQWIKVFYEGTSYSTSHSFTWDGKTSSGGRCAPGVYTWRLNMKDQVGNVSPVYRGTVTIAPIDLMVTVTPPVLVLTDDGTQEPLADLGFKLDDSSSVTATIYRLSGWSAIKVKTIYDAASLAAGQYSVTWEGLTDSFTYVESGEYEFRVNAQNSLGNWTYQGTRFGVEVDSIVIEDLSLSEAAISPDSDGIFDSTTCSVSLAQAADVDGVVEKDGVTVKTLAAGEFLLPGVYSYNWDGTDENGIICTDGTYSIRFNATNSFGVVNERSSSCVLDTTAPALRSCLLDRVPGYPGTFSLKAGFDSMPSSAVVQTVAGEVELTPVDGTSEMTAELSEAQLAGVIAIRSSDSLSNSAACDLEAHLPAANAAYEVMLTSMEDFSQGTLDGVDAAASPGYLSSNGAAPGSYTSQMIDLQGINKLGTLSWLSSSSPGTGVSCSIRTSLDGTTWSDWSASSQANVDLNSVLARYLQIKVDFPSSGVVPAGLAELRLSLNVDEVLTSDLADLRVDGLTVEPAAPEAGQSVTINVTFSNQGGPAIGPRFRLYQGAEQVGSDVAYIMLTPFASRQASFTYLCASPGSLTFTAVADPEEATAELDETNNLLSATVEVLPSGINASVLTDKASYLPEEDAAITSTIGNASGRDRYLAADVYIEDGAGNRVALVASVDLGCLIPGEEKTVSSSWNAGLTYSGDYRAAVSVREDSIEKARGTYDFAVAPQGSLLVRASSDRTYYSAGDTAMLRARLMSEAVNFCYSGLTVKAEVLSPEGTSVFASEQACPDMYPGDLADILFAFDVADMPPGVYALSVSAMDGEAVIAAAQASFEVRSSSFTGAGISGTLSALPGTIEQGSPFDLAYTLLNQGNSDLSSAPLWMLIVDPSTNEVMEARELTVSLGMGSSMEAMEGFSSASLEGAEGGKNYLAVLMLETGESAKTLGFTVLTVTPPVLDHLEISGITDQVAGVPFEVSVTAVSAWGLTVPYSDVVSLSDITGTLLPTQGEMVDGVFTGTFSVTASTSADTVTLSAGDMSVASNAFEVMAGPAATLSASEIASPWTAGEAFTLQASAFDAWGNPAISFNEACTITDTTGSVSPSSATFAGGELSADLTITKAISSSIVTVTAGGLSVSTDAFEVEAGPAVSLSAAEVASSQQAGTPFAIAVSAFDAWGNPATGFNEACTITDTTGTVSPQSASFSSGALSAQVTVTKATASDTITIDAGVLAISTNSFEVTAGPAASLAMAEIPSPQKTRIPFTISAEAFDAWGNLATGFNEACAITDTTGTVAPASAAFVSGQLSAEVTVYQKLASDTITITAAGITASSNSFEVKPNVDVEMTLSLEEEEVVPSVLVWTDTDLNEAMVTEVLEASGCYYTIVRADHSPGCGHGHKAGMEDFAAEMRSGAYNTFLLLSPDHPLEDHLADEVRERVNAGAGLLVSDPNNVNNFREHPAKGGVVDLFGIKKKGNLSPDTYTATLAESPLSNATTLTFTGKMKKVEIDDAQVLGTVNVTKGNKTETWPALTLKQYGLGSASLVAFDFADVAAADVGKAQAILANSLESLAAPVSALDAGLPLPLRLDLANLEAEAQVKVTIPLPSGVTLLWAEGGALEQGSVVFDLFLAEAEQKQLDMLLLPSQPADYTFTASLSYLDQGSYVFLKEASVTLSVAGDPASLKAEATAAIDALAVANKDNNNKSKACEQVEGIDLTAEDAGTIDGYIADLVKAVEYLQKIDSADTTDARLLADRLMIQLERCWYALSGGGS